jgi:heme oxygenase
VLDEAPAAPGPAAEVDVLQVVRAATAVSHAAVEESLALTDAALDRSRMGAVLSRMYGFWVAGRAGLDAWASAEPDAASALDWERRRRRTALIAEDLASLGLSPQDVAALPVPALPPVLGTGTALGRLYVLEGSTLGGVFIDRHLATLADGGDWPRITSFWPYGDDTGVMWRDFRAAVTAHVAVHGGDDVLAGAVRTFGELAAWCAPLRPVPA